MSKHIFGLFQTLIVTIATVIGGKLNKMSTLVLSLVYQKHSWHNNYKLEHAETRLEGLQIFAKNIPFNAR